MYANSRPVFLTFSMTFFYTIIHMTFFVRFFRMLFNFGIKYFYISKNLGEKYKLQYWIDQVMPIICLYLLEELTSRKAYIYTEYNHTSCERVMAHTNTVTLCMCAY